MLRLLIILFVSLWSSMVYCQDIAGHWVSYDDVTDEKKSVVEIYKRNGVYEAKIVEIFSTEKGGICMKCKGSKKDQPLVQMVIIEDLKKSGNEYSGGTILDPESGETYKCTLELMDSNKLKVRGYIGFSLFGRTQYWKRKEQITQ